MSDKELAHISARQPVRFIGRNFRGYMKNLKTRGKIWLGEMEMEREVWDLLDVALPEDAYFEVILWVVDPSAIEDIEPEEKPEKEPKPKKEPGPYSEYWRRFFAWGLGTAGPLRESLELAGEVKSDDVKLALRAVFGVDHISHSVSPEMFETWAAEHQLKYLVDESRYIVLKMKQQEERRQEAGVK